VYILASIALYHIGYLNIHTPSIWTTNRSRSL